MNAYAEPLITQDLDLVVAADDLSRVESLLAREFRVRRFEHSLNVYDPDSALQVQLQLGGDGDGVINRREVRDVLGLSLPVAHPRDLVVMKLAEAADPTRRPSKRGKDVLDVARLVSVFPELMSEVPGELQDRVRELVDPAAGEG